MYAAKAAGRRTHRFFEPEMDAQGQGAPQPGNGPASGHRRPCVRGSISALRQPARQQHHRLRSPAALAPPRTRRDLARRVHSDRGRHRPDQSARRMGADHGLRGGRELARRYQHRGQRFAGPVQERHLRVEGPGCPCRLRPAGEPAGTGDHRSGADPRRRGRARHPASASRHRRAHRARRFRHRLLLAELSAQIPVRQDQDRPLLHQRHRRGRRDFQHREGRGGYRRGAQHDHDSGRRRDRAATRNAARARLLRNAGLAVQPGEDRRRHQAAVLRAPQENPPP